jgi:hypothetical protein
MTLRLNGSTSGYTEIDAPAVAGSNTLVLPTGNGSADQALVTNGSGTLSFADRGRMTLATAQNSTSGTSIDFTGIPSWVKRITVMFDGVSTSGTARVAVQLGDSGGIETTGYASGSYYLQSTGAGGLLTNTTSWAVYWDAAAALRHGAMTICLLNASTNTWTSTHNFVVDETVDGCVFGAGTKSLSSTLDRIRITTTNGTDTFDAGTINILYEG